MLSTGQDHQKSELLRSRSKSYIASDSRSNMADFKYNLSLFGFMFFIPLVWSPHIRGLLIFQLECIFCSHLELIKKYHEALDNFLALRGCEDTVL